MTDSPLRLAFAVSLFFEFGGMQRSMLRIAQACAAAGHEVHLFTGGWQAPEPDNITVHVLDTEAVTNVRSNDLLAKKFAHAVAADGKFDCVIGFTKIPGLDVYYAGDPCYAERIHETRPWWYRWTSRYRGFRRQEAAVFARGLKTELMLIAHSERENFIKYYATEVERFHLLPPGINRSRFDSPPNKTEIAAFRKSLGVSENEQMLLLVGARFRTKGLDRALLALASLPAEQLNKTRLIIVGGDKQAPYQKQAEQLGVSERIHFTGARDNLVSFYHAADLLVHPPYIENTGTILIEAMLCSLPILVSGNCGFAYHVKDANAGLVCPEPFEQQIFNKLLISMLYSEQLPVWAENGPRYCEKTDLYSLIERAAGVIIARGYLNRQAAKVNNVA